MKFKKISKLLCVVFLVTFKYVNAQQTEQPKPNILWVLTDDQRYDAIRAFNKILDGREMSALG